jgi:hypothetical protein
VQNQKTGETLEIAPRLGRSTSALRPSIWR